MDPVRVPEIKIANITLVPGMIRCPASETYKDALQADKHGAFRLSNPKIVVGLARDGAHIAIGFPTDEHIATAGRAFGEQWKRRFREIGDGELHINFANQTVRISGMSVSLDGPVAALCCLH